MRAVPAGEIEAARAMGMSRGVMLRRVVLPAAFRRMLPAYGNEVIFMLQATVAGQHRDAVGHHRRRRRDEFAVYYLPFEAFLTAAVLYLAITMGLVGLFHAAERKLVRCPGRRGVPEMKTVVHSFDPERPRASPIDLLSLHYGTPGAGPKATLQAALHADEIPGLLVAHHLRERLA